MGRVLGQPSGLAGGRVGPGGRDIWDWVNQYWADLTKNVLFMNTFFLANFERVFYQFWQFLDL